MQARTVLARGIAQLRKERSWTQADLAEVAGVSLQFLAALEQDTKTPSLETIDKLCEAFGVTPSALFAAGEEAKAPRPRARTAALERALEAVPPAHEADVVELVHAVSRMLVRAKGRSGATKAPSGAKRRLR